MTKLKSKVIYLFLFITCIPFVANAFTYEHLSNGYFSSIHVLTVNPKEEMIIPVKATGDEICRETVLELATQYGAIAGINGGFWNPQGTPQGALKINHHWYGIPTKPRGAIGWSLTNQNVLIDRILTENSTNDQIEVVPVSNPPYTTPKMWRELENIVGGAPVLVKNGTIIEDFNEEKTRVSFLTNRHPRTAIGIKENGDWLFVVVDGRFYKIFGGMTMKELAELMFSLGAKDALNLDGGSSSTMVIHDIVINTPCGNRDENGKQVRQVSDAILIFPLSYP